ncbi:ACN9 family protein [Saitoella complicata NRRL Y-17804]|nr:ACN9 family protein [Saitoella complicata NRRL Y-17804]ODQ55240.1 ACN9 family protein [Saitoella complicata NRRL Y-17804]
MRSSLVALAKARSIRPPPPALLTAIPLYRKILRAHRRLPVEQRLLGDSYVKQEFRLHKDVDNPAYVIGFLSSWQAYCQDIEGDRWLTAKIDQHKVAKLSNEQYGQLYELMKASTGQEDGSLEDIGAEEIDIKKN